jgi:hypothetical protein
MPLRAVNPSYRTAKRQAAPARTHQYDIIPAPVLGLDFVRALPLQDRGGANVLENFTVRRSGAELRPGWKRWVSNLPGVVNSVMVYNPPRGAGSLLIPKIFAACDDGNIYDVTDPQTEAFVPPVAVAIPGQIVPGRFSWTNFSTAATNYLCICAAGGGYWTYDTTGGWINRTGAITGAGAAAAPNFDYVLSWKSRLWFIANNTADVYFLGVNAIQGSGQNFDFGPLLTHGGHLSAMGSWTVDAGNGIDDKLVLVAQGGDVLVYEGTDPASAAAFRMIGRWFAGRPPEGRRFMSKYGGDLLMITSNGADFMSRILRGRGLMDPEGPGIDDPAARYNEVIGEQVRNTYGLQFWSPIFIASEQVMMVITPFNTVITGKQHIFSALQRAWSTYAGLPIVCADTLDGVLYFGTPDGTVGRLFAAPTDDELSDGTVGREVLGRLQSAYVAPGKDVMALKRPVLVMPMFIGANAPKARVQVNTEWNSESPPGSPAYVAPVVALWDISRWDQAVWVGGLFTFQGWVGCSGLGVFMSLAMTLAGSPRTLFTSWKLVYESGGIT